MSRTSTLILIGILIILTPFSGLPIAFRTLIAVILGVCVSGIGFAIRAQEARDMLSRTKVSPATAVTPGTVDPSSEAMPQEPRGVSPI